MAEITSSPLTIVNETGFHARPAANLAKVAKQYQSDIKLLYKEMEANAKSMVSVMCLEVNKGDQIQIKADGVDADEAIKAISTVIMTGCGE